MTTFDWVVVAVIALSTLLAFFRGVVRELVAVVAWVLGFVGAIAFTPALGALLPSIPGYPGVPYLIAFALIVIGALLLGALIAWPLTKAIRAAGLGFVDRFLGSIFGLVRGAALMLAFVIVAGLTPLPRADSTMRMAPGRANRRTAGRRDVRRSFGWRLTCAASWAPLPTHR